MEGATFLPYYTEIKKSLNYASNVPSGDGGGGGGGGVGSAGGGVCGRGQHREIQ
jgi:hypothetical protein